jgi:Acyltransferase
MNIQPYGNPAKHWPPKLTPWWFHATRTFRRRALGKQKMSDVTVLGLEHLARAADAGMGVLITPNHSFHWDSYCLAKGAESLRLPFYVMTAWQVFGKSKWFERESMQRCGCFSIDREGTDVQSLKTVVEILQSRPNPLVIFPEGDIYHTNDVVTPFRDGAAAMALMAARKSERPIAIIPVAIKRWYVDDPMPSLLRIMDRIEQRMLWRPRSDLPIVERIIRVAYGLVSLKEIEHRQAPQMGNLTERICGLANWILSQAENRYQLAPKNNTIPERIKAVRRSILLAGETAGPKVSSEQQFTWDFDMHNMFLVTQLFSYPGDYLTKEPTLERIAETIDKLEEDTLSAAYPTVHATRRVTVQFDAPIVLPMGKEKRLSTAELTDQIESRVQAMLNQLNRLHVASSYPSP